MGQVPQGRQRDGSVRIVGQQGLAGPGPGAADNPVVGAVEALKRHTGVRSCRRAEGAHRDPGQIEVRDGIELAGRIQREQRFEGGLLDLIEQACPIDLHQRIARHGQCRHPLQRHVLTPRLRPEPLQGKLDRRVVPNQPDLRVDASHERADNLLRVRRIAGPLCFHVTPVLEQPGKPISLHQLRPQHLGQQSIALAPPDFHLPKPILRSNEPLRKEEVRHRPRIDVRNTPLIAANLNCGVEPGNRDPPLDLGQTALGFCQGGLAQRRRGTQYGKYERQQ